MRRCKIFASFSLIITLLCIMIFSSCNTLQSPEEKVNVMHTQWEMLEGKDTQTTVHKFSTDKEGPKIVIIGGTHGDEVAGWTTALNLVSSIPEQKGICGEILLIPQLNVLADNAKKRYVSSYNGTAYSDLNRAFPLGRQSSAKKATIEITEALITEIKNFVGEEFEENEGEGLILFDLHESQHSIEDGYLGNTLIYLNNVFFMEDLLDYYNETYRLKDEPFFSSESAVKAGSFSHYYSNTYKKAVVFTIETNREVKNGTDTIDLSFRVNQQTNMINSLFDLQWKRK